MKGVNKIVFPLLTVAGIYLSATPVFADGHCCAKCGCQEDVRCICRPIYTTKYIEITCWDSVCEEVCLPPPGRCKEGSPEGAGAKSLPANSQSRTADAGKDVKIRSCNKLVRKTYLQPIPTVVWVVEYLCPSCRGGEKTYSIRQDSTGDEVYISRFSEGDKHD